MDIEALKRQAAALAVEWVRPGMRLGLGTGSTARHFVELLAERVRGGPRCRRRADLGDDPRPSPQRLGVPLTTLDETPALDLTVDGADEIAPDLSLIKGGGGALLREKIVAAASARMVVIADEAKWVPALGRFPLADRGRAVRLGGDPRADRGGGRGGRRPRAERSCGGTRTAMFSSRTAATGFSMPPRAGSPIRKSLAERLSLIPGVVEHGLFIGLAQAAILAGPAGVRVVERS